MVHLCLDCRGVPQDESERGDLSDEEAEDEDDVLEDFGVDIGGSPTKNNQITISRANSLKIKRFSSLSPCILQQRSCVLKNNHIDKIFKIPIVLWSFILVIFKVKETRC